MKKQKGVITVFFCLLSIIFIALCFSIVEAVRLAGAQAECANITSLGLWSVFSEYENPLLEDYNLFAVDGSYGSETFEKAQLATKLDSYMKKNTDNSEGISGKLQGFITDPWKVSPAASHVKQYALLSDKSGEYYYQQAVEYMHNTAWANAIGKLKAIYSNSSTIRQAESEFESSKSASDETMKSVDKEMLAAENEARGTETSQTDSSGNIVIIAQGQDAEKLMKAEEGKKKNPLDKISSLISRSLLELVAGSGNVSTNKLSSGSLLSKRRKDKGKLSLDTPRGGMVDNLLFREYLVDHFPDFSDSITKNSNNKVKNVLRYQIEYILGGKNSDSANLKKVVKKLLLLREGFNYSFLVTNTSYNLEATQLATLIAGWTTKPLLVAGVKHAILLAWAYGESLFDVRVLLHGGKVPLTKTASTWNVPLSKLIDIETELSHADTKASGKTSGLSYKDFLRLLLNIQGIRAQKIRSLDLIELNIRQRDGFESFRIDNCIVGVKVKTTWDIPSVFGKIPSALLGTDSEAYSISIDGGFSYR